MRLRLPELQEYNPEAKKLKSTDLPEIWEDIKYVLWYQALKYGLEIIFFKIISCYHNNLLAGYFGIDKSKKLVARKYFWPIIY